MSCEVPQAFSECSYLHRPFRLFAQKQNGRKISEGKTERFPTGSRLPTERANLFAVSWLPKTFSDSHWWPLRILEGLSEEDTADSSWCDVISPNFFLNLQQSVWTLKLNTYMWVLQGTASTKPLWSPSGHGTYVLPLVSWNFVTVRDFWGMGLSIDRRHGLEHSLHGPHS